MKEDQWAQFQGSEITDDMHVISIDPGIRTFTVARIKVGDGTLQAIAQYDLLRIARPEATSAMKTRLPVTVWTTVLDGLFKEHPAVFGYYPASEGGGGDSGKNDVVVIERQYKERGNGNVMSDIAVSTLGWWKAAGRRVVMGNPTAVHAFLRPEDDHLRLVHGDSTEPSGEVEEEALKSDGYEGNKARASFWLLHTFGRPEMQMVRDAIRAKAEMSGVKGKGMAKLDDFADATRQAHWARHMIHNPKWKYKRSEVEKGARRGSSSPRSSKSPKKAGRGRGVNPKKRPKSPGGGRGRGRGRGRGQPPSRKRPKKTLAAPKKVFNIFRGFLG